MRLRITLFLLVVFVGLFLFVPWSYETTAPAMGTTVRVKVRAPLAFWRAHQAIAEIKRLEKIFRPVMPAPDTTRVLAMAETVRKASNGAFNVCWSGKIDLGGIGKGYAVEVARQLLLKNGVKSAIIDMHSSIAVIGDGWKIGIFDPRTKEYKYIFKRIILNDGEALATSGQYEQPGHIVDPRTGRPADKCKSVTVVCKDAGLADALSTAIFVLGRVQGERLAAKMGAQTFIVDKDGKTYDNIGSKLR